MRFPRALVLACILTAGTAFADDDLVGSLNDASGMPKPMHTEQMVTVLKNMMNDAQAYAARGDKEMDALVRKNHIEAQDWNALPRDEKKATAALQQFVLGLYELSKTDDNAKALMEKFKIKVQTTPSSPP